MTHQNDIEAYPLQWPAGWPRTAKPKQARFSAGRGDNWRSRGATMTAARDVLIANLHLLGAAATVISSNVPVRKDRLPYANAREPEDSGVAVYFTLHGEQRCFPCDRWDRVADNIHAIGLSIGALRGLERWGAKHMVDAAFTGFKALPAGPQWWQVLGLESDRATRKQIERAYREEAMKRHPDAGGKHEQMVELQEAYRTGLELVGNGEAA